MQRTKPDTTGFMSTFTPPGDTRGLFEQIVREAQASYPDHEKSRTEMIFQRLLETIEDRDAALKILRQRRAELLAELQELRNHGA